MNGVAFWVSETRALVAGLQRKPPPDCGGIRSVAPGEFEDDPNVTNKKFPGNPTQSFRTREPLHVVGELVDWIGHSPEKLQATRDVLDTLKRQGAAQIED